MLSASASSPMSLPPDIGKITEPELLGHLMQWALFGVLSVQVYIYHLAFPNDPFHRKLLVYAVYIAEMFQAIVLARMAYIQFATGFGNLDALDAIPVILWFSVPILNGIVGAVVQIFYAYRIKILADSYPIPSVVVLLALVQLGGGIALGITVGKKPFFSQLLRNTTYIPAGIFYGGSALCDVLIAVSMTYLLSRRKSESKKTQQLIQKIMRLTIGTGILTAAFAIINLVLFLIPSKPVYFEAVSQILGKMYSNTMMVVLNSRMVYGITNGTLSTRNKELSVLTFKRSLFFNEQVGISVTHSEQRSDQLQHPLEDDFKTDTTWNSLEDNIESVAEAMPEKRMEV